MTEYILTIRELPTGRLTIDGLPEDRTERQSFTWRLLDTLKCVTHADDVDREGDGILWQRYAKASYVAGWLPEATVTLVPAER